MKYFVYVVLVILGGFLFLPQTGTSEIRNPWLLILILSLVVISILIRLLKYILLMAKTKKLLKQNEKKVLQIRFLPLASLFRGHYSITFECEDKIAQIILISRKRNYLRYHFDSINRLEFYQSNRVVFKNTKVYGATISNLVETQRVGKQRIKWNDSANIRMIVFDRLPGQMTDSVKAECLGAGDRICGSDVYVLDWASFKHKLDEKHDVIGNIYKLYLKNRKNSTIEQRTKTVFFDNEGVSYRVIITKKRANKLSIIQCKNSTILWEQIPFLYLRYNERGRGNIVDSIPVSIDKNIVTLFIIKGKPRSIWGLDEGIFRSSKQMDVSCVNVMSEKKFKEL